MPELQDDFLLMCGDVMLSVDFCRFIRFHRGHQAWASLMAHPNGHPYDSSLLVTETLPPAEKGGLPIDTHRVTGWLNKEDERRYYQNRVNAGIEILSPHLLDDVRSHFVPRHPEQPDKIDLDRDVLKPNIKSGRIFAYDTSEYIKDMGTEGTLKFELPEGTHKVVIYLAVDATILIKNFSIDSSYEVPVKNTKVLWLGDSITQGYGSLRSSESYVSITNRTFDYDIINQGIGGYIYDCKSLMKMPGYVPDKIVVAHGTNQYGDKDMSAVEKYYEVLTGIYGTEIPVYCITPIWRGDNIEALPVFYTFCENVKKVASKYPNVRIIDGLDLVPHLEEYYTDNLHPNLLGTETYAANLVKELKKLGF